MPKNCLKSRLSPFQHISEPRCRAIMQRGFVLFARIEVFCSAVIVKQPSIRWTAEGNRWIIGAIVKWLFFNLRNLTIVGWIWYYQYNAYTWYSQATNESEYSVIQDSATYQVIPHLFRWHLKTQSVYWEGTHEPIIAPATFEQAQERLRKIAQQTANRKKPSRSAFSGLIRCGIICGDCGAFFGSKVWNSTSKYRRVIWRCNNKFKGEHKCETPHLDEETIKTRFVGAFNAILADKDSALENCRLMQSTLTDCSGLDAEIEFLLEEIDVVTELTKRCIAENSQTAPVSYTHLTLPTIGAV